MSSSYFPLIDQTVFRLFKHEFENLARQFENLINQNNEVIGQPCDGFIYMGRFFNKPGLRGYLRRKTLDMSLYPIIEDILKQENTLKDHAQQIRQVLAKLLYGCMSAQDIRDNLPDCLLDFLPDWVQNLDRIRTPAFTIVGDTRSQRDYDEALPLIEMYSVSRMIL